jgi:CrcB protein
VAHVHAAGTTRRRAEASRVNQWAAVGAVAVGGAIGSVLRFLIATWSLQWLGPSFPWGTFAINVSGSFAIGLVLQAAETRAGLPAYLRLFVATGVLGGYTTFSTFAYETYLLSRDGFSMQSLWYGLGSVVAGVAAVLLGIFIGRAVFS